MSLEKFKEKLLREETAYLLGMLVALGLALRIAELETLEVWMRVYGAMVLVLSGIACAAGWAFANWDERSME